MKDAMIFLKNIKTYVSAKTEKKNKSEMLGHTPVNEL